jgi:hypothetical protein
MTWRYTVPQSNDDVSEFPTVVQELKSAISDGLGKHFYWQENSGTSAGEPRLSTVSGSARAFYDVASRISAKWDGALMVTSDATPQRLAMLNSVSSAYIGSTHAILGYSASTFTSTERYAFQVGSVYTSGASATVQNLTFPSAFSATPLVVVSVGYSDITAIWTHSILSANASGFSYALLKISGSGLASESSATMYWRAYGRQAV